MNGWWGAVRRHLVDRSTLYLAVLIVILSVAVVARYPVYFRTDDAYYLSWASSHGNPLDAFSASQGIMFGVLRPVHTLTWWLLYRAFGHDAAGYQVVLTLVYAGSFLFLFLFVKHVVSYSAAVISLVAFGVMFSSLTHVAFWFSDLTFALELLFGNAALYMLGRAFGDPRRPAGERRGCLEERARGRSFLVGGFVCYVLAGLSKEPAILVVPAVAATYAWTLRERRRFGPAAIVLLALGVAWTLGSPYLRGRQGVPLGGGMEPVIGFVAERWAFYARRALTGVGGLALFSVLFLASRGWGTRRVPGAGARACPPIRRSVVSLATPSAVAAAVAALLSGRPRLGLLLLLLGAAVVFLRGRRESHAAVWAALPLLGILTAKPYFSVYLTETAVGLSVLTGVALSLLIRDALRIVRTLPSFVRWSAAVLLLATVVAVGAGLAPRLRSAERAARVVSDARQDFRRTIEYLLSSPPGEARYVVVVSYRDLGISTLQQLLERPLHEAAALQKTMSSPEMGVLLGVMGAHELEVKRLGWYLDNRPDEPAFLVAMNRREREHVESLNLDAEEVFSTAPASDSFAEGAWIFRLRAGGGASGSTGAPGGSTGGASGPTGSV